MRVRIIPEFGGDEEFFARNTGIANALAHTHFVAIDGGGVDGAVAELDGLANDLWGGIIGSLPRAQPDCRCGAAIVECFDLHGVSHSTSFRCVRHRWGAARRGLLS